MGFILCETLFLGLDWHPIHSEKDDRQEYSLCFSSDWNRDNSLQIPIWFYFSYCFICFAWLYPKDIDQGL